MEPLIVQLQKPGKENIMAAKEQSFEKSLKELEEIAYKLENDELGLEESIKEYEKGMNLAKFCHNKLEEAERKIEMLQKGNQGSVKKKEVKVNADTGEIENSDDMQGSLL